MVLIPSENRFMHYVSLLVPETAKAQNKTNLRSYSSANYAICTSTVSNLTCSYIYCIRCRMELCSNKLNKI